jgi:putative transposase
VEDLLAERGLDISYETVRSWVLKFGPVIARRLRQRRPHPSDRWHLDEILVRIAGERMYLWRAVDHEGEVLDMLAQRRRDGRAARRLTRDDVAVAIDQDRDVELEGLDAAGDLPDLLFAVAPRVGGVELKLVDPSVDDFPCDFTFI